MDCSDHAMMSAWWVGIIGGERVVDDRGYSYLKHIPNVPFDAIAFLPVPEVKSAKNRAHIDLVSEHVDAIIAAGARLLRAPDGDIDWHVLADPEGNEFCVFAPR